MAVPFDISQEERRILGAMARLGVMNGFAGRDALHSLPAPPDGVLHEPLGCFVTITLNNRLRGCIGAVMAGDEPLFRNAARMAFSAAFKDSRFPPLNSEEWERTDMEISVLGPITPCPDPEAVEVGRHGLVLRYAGHSGVFLPKVPVQAGWDRLTYLDQLCAKAGLPAGIWRRPDAALYWYEALAFPV